MFRAGFGALFSAVLLIFAMVPASAEEPSLTEQLALDFHQRCAGEDLDSDQPEFAALASRVSRNRASLELDVAEVIMECLEISLGGQWAYDPHLEVFRTGLGFELAFQRFSEAQQEINERQLAARLSAAERLLAEEREAMRREVILATIEACREFYRRDRLEALVSPVCNSIFLETGLPNEL